jgi:CRISPR-associated endonuclease/helicase Cas3
MPLYYARSAPGKDKSFWQIARNHLDSVALKAGENAEPLGISGAAQMSGGFHDTGKLSPDFAARLEGSTARVDHSTAGAAIALLKSEKTGTERAMAELVAYGIAGHHAGLPDMYGSDAALATRLSKFDFASLDPAWATMIPDSASILPSKQFQFPIASKLGFQISFMGRMLFSCLVDADYRDAAAFHANLNGSIIDAAWLPLATLLPHFSEQLSRKISALQSVSSPIGAVRKEIFEKVVAGAEQTPGFFKMTVPTGGGKTLASLGFALRHAELHQKSRIIYAIPFTSVIDQTSDIVRGLFGAEHVLEHHSAVVAEDGEHTDKMKLAMEDWEAPVILTTTVQLFESLFSAKPSRARKLRNIANAVIVLDEVQALPRHLLLPCLAALEELVTNYGCTVVLCTATQPSFEHSSITRNDQYPISLTARELSIDPERAADTLRRVTVIFAGEQSDAQIVANLEGLPQALVILNTRRHALDLYCLARAAGLEGLMHLSTRQCALHRRAVLATVRSRLAEGSPCLLIATSLVEAGVDLNFPRAWRELAGLDQIAQAAGRCNREGRQSADQSVVTVFQSPDSHVGHDLRVLGADTLRVAARFEDVLAPASLTAYFNQVFGRNRSELDTKEILKKFSMQSGDEYVTNFAYRTVDSDFIMIDDVMMSVVVPYGRPVAQFVDELASLTTIELSRVLQNYTVQVPNGAAARMLACGDVRETAVGQAGATIMLLVNTTIYHPDAGLVWDGSAMLPEKGIQL